MTTKLSSFRDVIGLWDTAEALAEDIGELGVTVRQWGNRDNIPSGYWVRIIAAAKRRKKKLGTDDLAAIAARKAPPKDRGAVA